MNADAPQGCVQASSHSAQQLLITCWLVVAQHGKLAPICSTFSLATKAACCVKFEHAADCDTSTQPCDISTSAISDTDTGGIEGYLLLGQGDLESFVCSKHGTAAGYFPQ